MERLVEGRPARDLDPAQPSDEPVEEIRRLPPEIVVVEDPRFQERALVDVSGGGRVQGHEAPQDVAIHALDALVIARQGQIRVERRVAQVLEQRALVRAVLGQERWDRHGVPREESGVREMPLEVWVLRPAFHQDRGPAVVPHAVVAAVRAAEPDENRVGPQG